MTGVTVARSQFTQAVAAAPLEANGPRTHYMRATLERTAAGALAAKPGAVAGQFAAVAARRRRRCLIVRPVGAAAVAAGEPIPVLPLDF